MNSSTNLLLTATGFFLLGLVFYDVYATIIRATKHSGPISQILNRSLWWLATSTTQNFDRRRRHRILSVVGPLLMPFLIGLFVVFLLVGFALIYLPRMETAFKIQETQGNPGLQAFYFSGITLLTIGYGDILPVTGFTKILAVLEGASGIAVISLSITYLLNVSGALERKRAVALKFYHQARQGADISGYISSHFARGRFHSLTQSLREATHDLQELLESHIEHPVIHYFHPVEVYKGFPRAIFVVLETVAILNAHLDEAEYIEAGDHPDVLIAGDNARHVLAELVTSLKLEAVATKPFETAQETRSRRRRCFNRTLKYLQKTNIKTRSDTERAFREYDEDREAWERQLYRFADFLGYDWNEVTGDSSLKDATDDEVTERHEPLTV